MKKFYETGLLEAGTYDEEKGELTLTVIQPGFNTSKSRFYPEEMLKRDHRVFEGAKMFLDHQTAAEEKARPEGSVRSWVGQIKKIWAETDGRIRGTCAVIDESFRAKLKNLNAHGLLGEMGVSIRAAGDARESEIQGVKTNIIERLIKGRSVDFVTFPGAGGRVETMESEQSEEDIDMDEKLKELAAKLAESATENEQLKKDLEEKTKELSGKLAESVTENEQLKQRVEASERAVRQATAKAEIDGLLSESALPEIARNRIAKRFEGAQASDGIKEAIAEEKAYVESIRLAEKAEQPAKVEETEKTKTKPIVKNLGESTSVAPDSKPDEARLRKRREVFESLGMSPRAAEMAVMVN